MRALSGAVAIGCSDFRGAVMTDLLAMPAHGRVLEIGTGCGYQAAVLAQICAEVYSVEIVETLGREARERLARLGYDNVQVRIGDGADGWPAHAPYDGIVVTAAGDEVPPSLLGQLAPGGRLIMPVRSGPGDQNLVLCEKDREGMVHSRSVLPVVFVPLTGSRG